LGCGTENGDQAVGFDDEHPDDGAGVEDGVSSLDPGLALGTLRTQKTIRQNLRPSNQKAPARKTLIGINGTVKCIMVLYGRRSVVNDYRPCSRNWFN
jgi:hypothetical protein